MKNRTSHRRTAANPNQCDNLVVALNDLVEYLTTGEGSGYLPKNPYMIPEIKRAMATLRHYVEGPDMGDAPYKPFGLPAPKRVRRDAAARRRKADDGQYEAVIENTSQGPGKFEGEGAVGEWAYDKATEGWGETIGDEFFGVYTVVTLDKPVLVNERDGTSWTFMGFSVYEDDNGFAYIEYYDTAEEATSALAKLESDYQEDIEERPRGDY